MWRGTTSKHDFMLALMGGYGYPYDMPIFDMFTWSVSIAILGPFLSTYSLFITIYSSPVAAVCAYWFWLYVMSVDSKWH